MIRATAYFLGIIFLGFNVARADDGLDLKRGGNGKDVSISGVSSGAAMAVQYAVAHSGSIVGVGSIAGPGWGCAEGSVFKAINDCMCGREPVASKIDAARALATNPVENIDRLVSGKPQALKRSYVFHSAEDHTVVGQSGKASIEFLASFIGQAPVVDWGNPNNGSNRAGHGIISPDGNDSCEESGQETTYVRRCGNEDNAGKLFHALFGDGTTFDASKRKSGIPDGDVWEFNQKRLIAQVKSPVAWDGLYFGWPYSTARRLDFDMAETGYLYVPPSCRSAGSKCRVHIALHGCKQKAKEFAIKAGYNNWAEHYKVIVVYPALKPDIPVGESVCKLPPVLAAADLSVIEPNANGCWDWWGYLDGWWTPRNRYLTRGAPQMQVIERIIAEVTGAAK